MGRCSHCGVQGHTYLRCPQLTPQQIEEIKKKKKEEKEAVAQRRLQRHRRRNVVQDLPRQEHIPPVPADLNFEVVNMTDYELVCYYKIDHTNFKRFLYIPSHSSKPIVCKKGVHIAIFPAIELVIENGIDTRQYVNLENDYTKFFECIMEQDDDGTIIIDKDYKPSKSELEEWKELALKSHYLLTQIRDMTSQKKDEEFIVNKKYENIEPFIDMVQDIVIPNTCTEADKEKAGIPSALTNIT
tara:strand:- start:732 stop:1457 length:726 start_codon:yes stop_codon:yes gene_type:complete